MLHFSAVSSTHRSLLRRGVWAAAILCSCVSAMGQATPQAPAPAPRELQIKGNPIISDGSYYSADAAPISVDGKLYIHFGNDRPNIRQGTFIMSEYGVMVTDDPTSGKWTVYQKNLNPGQVFSWATGDKAYAGQVARGADKKFYWYVPVEWKETNVPNRMAIGVAVSDSPLGPWTDPIGKPLLTWRDVFGTATQGQEVIDPHVFTDTDGTVYLYWGSWNIPRAVKLKPTMTELDGTITRLTGVDAFFEAPWVFKRNDTYYILYDWKRGGSQWTPSNYQAAIGYATSKSPMGPFQFQGIILSGTSATTVHPSMVEHKDHWYVTYHTRDAKEGGHFRRSVAIDEVKWDGDKILPVKQTWADNPYFRLTRNLGIDAKVSVSFTEQPPMTVRALNDGRPESVRLPPDTWGNFRGTSGKQETDWVQYTWDVPVQINGTGIQFHRDNNWIRPPAKWVIEYQDDQGKWVPVTLDSYPTAVDRWQEVSFPTVKTKALRATFWGLAEGANFHSVAVSEWEVYGVQAQKLANATVKTTVGKAPQLPATIDLPFEGGTQPVPVRWRDVEPRQFEKAGTFTVEGRAAGQSAGLIKAEVTVGN